MKNKKLVVFSIIFLIGAFFLASFAFKQNETSSLENLSNKQGAPFIREYSPMFGSKDKKVTIVEFLDPQCGACKSFHGAIKKVYSDYESDVRLVIRYLDNHKNSAYAIKILEASRLQGKFKETLDVIFYYQDRWAEHNNPKPMLLWDYLPQVSGLDIKKLKTDVQNIDISSVLATDRADAKTLGVMGTPEFFVNGKKLMRLSYTELDDLVISQIYK